MWFFVFSFYLNMPTKLPKKVLLLGSGPLKIGEAGEFDYSGSQAIKALKEERIETILVNPNIATVQTSENLANRVYFLPITPYFVTKIIEKEKIDGVLIGFGGQTALNCALALWQKGIFKKNKVKVLGTSMETIELTENRKKFCLFLKNIHLKTPQSFSVTNVKESQKAAQQIGWPIMVRSAYTLGGQGSGIAFNQKQLQEIVISALAMSPQVLVEEYLYHYKEVEYEVMRDRYGNCVTICNMENIDPMGIHTGESMVVAPSLTLTNQDYHQLRSIAIKLIQALEIVGECNIQFALNRENSDYRIIEVNSRLSRSSALASKATGYPLAYLAAKLALGHSLPSLKNLVTKATTACFEPALDYLVLKIPRWDFDKFKRTTRRIGTSMQSIGEVMAAARSFEEALQKAIRMLNSGKEGIMSNNQEPMTKKRLEILLKIPNDQRIFAISKALEQGMTVKRIAQLSGIDPWFISKINNIVKTAFELKRQGPKPFLLKKAKEQGFSDKQIGGLLNNTLKDVTPSFNLRRGGRVADDSKKIKILRKKYKIEPVTRQIDTLAAEYPAQSNYLYLTYHGLKDDQTVEAKDKPQKNEQLPLGFKEKPKVMVLGSGPYAIGSSVEFDWSATHSIFTLKKLGYETIMVNCNPETVSTDYDIADKLYFEELSLETIEEIFRKENPLGVIVSVGGQIPNNLVLKLYQRGIKILGTHPTSIDRAENRYKFSHLLLKLNIDQPEWREVQSLKEAKQFAKLVSYPVLLRPSYVLSGTAMQVVFCEEELEEYLKKARLAFSQYPVVLSKFITEAKEIEIDAVAQNGQVIVWAISEHIENAGVHSGDATLVLPPQKTYLETLRRIKEITWRIAFKLKINGPFNIQFLAKDNEIKVIECNLRASRSLPFVSKVTKVNFIELATRVMVNASLPQNHFKNLDLDYVGVKSPQFSFFRLKDSDPLAGVEMASTGEAASLGRDDEEAFLKSILAVGFELPQRNILVSIGKQKNKIKLLESILKLTKMGFRLFATRHTSEFLLARGIKNTFLHKIQEKKKPNILDYFQHRRIDLVINIPSTTTRQEITSGYLLRRCAIDFHIPLISDLNLVRLFIEALFKKKMGDLEIKAWDEY